MRALGERRSERSAVAAAALRAWRQTRAQALQEAAAKAVLEAAKKAAGQGQLLDKKQLKAVADAVRLPLGGMVRALGHGARERPGSTSDERASMVKQEA